MRHLSRALIMGLLIFCLGALALPCLAGPRSSPAGAEPALVDQFWSVQRLRGASAPPSSGVDRIGQDQGLPQADRDLEILASPEPPGSTAPFCPEGPQGISPAPAAEQPLAISQSRTCPVSSYDLAQDPSNLTYPQRVMGRVFFNQRGQARSCSGALIHRRVVLTASHCVCDQYGWYDNVIFVPGYLDGSEPHGRGHSQKIWGFQDHNTNENNDVAMIILQEDLGSTLGWLGTAWNENAHAWTQYGYPADEPYDGNRLYVNQSVLGERLTSGFLAGVLLVGSGFTAGTSGGPWLIHKSGLPHANGINSLYLNDCPRTFGSPYFSSQFVELLDEVSRDLGESL